MSSRSLASLAASAVCVLALVAVACGDPSGPGGRPIATGGIGGTGSFGAATGTGADAGFGNGTGGTTGAGGTPEQLLSGKSAHSDRAAPILGGTLLVTRDGATAVAADPDRDAVFLVDLHTLAVSSIAFEEGDQPGRVLEGPEGRVFVLTRGSGVLVALDVAAGEIAYRVPLCRSPRGIDYDPTTGTVFVACRSGLVLNLDAASGELLSRAQFDEDLRDVLVRGKELLLTRARSSEVLVVSEAGRVLRRAAPRGDQPSHLFRSLLLPSGELLLAHQAGEPGSVGLRFGGFGGTCRLSAVPPTLSVTTTEAPAPMTGGALPPDPRDRPVAQAMAFTSVAVTELVGPLDLALAPEAGRFALLASGNAWNLGGPGRALIVGPLAENGGLSEALRTALGACGSKLSKSVSGEPIAVALDTKGRAYVQSREPAALVLDNGVSVPLSKVSRADTGLALFYMNAGGDIACASCHPEGEDDGLAWASATSGMRRTQSLAGGLAARAPYHWAGEFSTLDALMNGVFLQRMAAQRAPTQAQVESLDAWLAQLPAPQVAEELDSAAVERGRARFFAADGGCADCHGGTDFSDHQLHDVGTNGMIKTPSLLGVSARAPYFHDGCAVGLQGIFGVCGGTAHGNALSLDEKADLVEFLRSL